MVIRALCPPPKVTRDVGDEKGNRKLELGSSTGRRIIRCQYIQPSCLTYCFPVISGTEK